MAPARTITRLLENPALEPAKPIHWRVPAVIAVLGTLAFSYARLSDNIESNFRFPISALCVLLTLFLLVLWWLFFTGMKWRSRFYWMAGGVALVAAAVVFAKLTLRIDGSSSGAGVPQFTWKWTPKTESILKPPVSDSSQLPAHAKLVIGTSPDDSPQFLGSNRRGILDTAQFNRDWTAHPPKELWRQPVGLGWSSYAVAGKYAVTQEQRGAQELAVCYEVATGKVQWEHGNTARFTEDMGGDGPRATPTIEDGFVYVLGATGILDCVDASDGRLIWSRSTLVENQLKNLTWGKSSSPLVYQDLVVVSGGDTEGPSLLAYNKKTGAPVWRAGHDKSGYGSPVLSTLAGKEQITIVNARSVSGHASDDGHLLWEYAWPGDWPKSAQTVLLGDDRIFFSAGYGIGCVLLKVSKSSESTFSATVVWKNKSLKAPFSNVVLRDGFLYGLDDETLACVEVATGQRRWKDGHYGHGQVILAGDLLIVQSETGEVALVEAKPDAFNELAKLPGLSSKTWNVPVLSGRNLLVRNDREAACYQLPPP